MSEDNKALKALLDGISLMIDEKLKLAGFDRSVVGFITGANLENNTYTVKINGYEYQNVKSVIGDLGTTMPCICTIPQNQMSQMYISGIIDSTNYIEGGGGDTGGDYNELNNKPSINGVTLIGNKTASDLGISQPTKTSQLTNDSHFIVDANYVHTDNNFTNALLSKLNGIENNAQVNIIEAIKVNNVTQPITDKTVNLTISASGMYYGSCATSANVNSKLVTIPSAQGFELKIGAVIGVKFTNTNTYSASAEYPITLNVNSTGAKNIYYADSGNPLGDNPIAFGRADYINYYQYDGTYWIWCGSSSDDGVNYDVITANEISTGTDTTPKVVRADYLKAGIQAIVNAMSLGHTIWNKIKTALTKRPNLWFKDAYVTDDSTNDSTNIEVIQTVTEAQWENLATTDDGFYDIDDGTALPLTADLISYDNTSSGLTANQVQDAIDELNAEIVNGGTVRYDATTDRFEVLYNGSWVQSIRAFAQSLAVWVDGLFGIDVKNGVKYASNHTAYAFTVDGTSLKSTSISVNQENTLISEDPVDFTNYSTVKIKYRLQYGGTTYLQATAQLNVSGISQNAYLGLSFVRYDTAHYRSICGVYSSNGDSFRSSAIVEDTVTVTQSGTNIYIDEITIEQSTK